MKVKNIWIVGCGDIGCRVATLYKQEANKQNASDCMQTIRGIIRSESSRERCEHLGIKPLQYDLSKNTPFPASQFTHADVYYFAPPPAVGTEDSTLQHFLARLNKHVPRRIVLISTTGVYGDTQGDWIDETSPLNPVADRAKRRYSAEQSLIRWADKHTTEYMILRVPGIYAKERLPLARLQKGLPVVKESEAGFSNRIHADDLAVAAKAAMQSTHKNQIYNVTDGKPSSMTDYFNQVADFAGLPRPPQISLQEAENTLSAGIVSYLKESRRIKNDKMIHQLGIILKYPDIQSALNH
jgi:nucleoside-diphosphate-sugar epimerase